jgi:chromosome segregation ATPase
MVLAQEVSGLEAEMQEERRETLKKEEKIISLQTINEQLQQEKEGLIQKEEQLRLRCEAAERDAQDFHDRWDSIKRDMSRKMPRNIRNYPV